MSDESNKEITVLRCVQAILPDSNGEEVDFIEGIEEDNGEGGVRERLRVVESVRKADYWKDLPTDPFNQDDYCVYLNKDPITKDGVEVCGDGYIHREGGPAVFNADNSIVYYFHHGLQISKEEMLALDTSGQGLKVV